MNSILIIRNTINILYLASIIYSSQANHIQEPTNTEHGHLETNSNTQETVTSEQGDGVFSTEHNHLAGHTSGNTETTTINPNYKELEEYINTLPPNTARKILYELAIDEIETKGEKSKFGQKLGLGN